MVTIQINVYIEFRVVGDLNINSTNRVPQKNERNFEKIRPNFHRVMQVAR